MPYFSIQTNLSMDADRIAGLGSTASAFAAALLGKPESYVMTALKPATPMTFAGSDGPAAFVELKSIGLPAEQCTAYAAQISDFIRDELGIDPGRVFIDFTDLPRDRFAWNGKTFG